MVVGGDIWVNGAISVDDISSLLKVGLGNGNIGAYEIFLGQVRSDFLEDGRIVEAIEYTTYDELAQKVFSEILREGLALFPVENIIVRHSLGTIDAGKICFLVLVTSKRRLAARDACSYLVEEIKRRSPIFGKEILRDGGIKWKKNT